LHSVLNVVLIILEGINRIREERIEKTKWKIINLKKKIKTKASSANNAKAFEVLQEEALNQGISSNLLLPSMSINPLATKLQLVLIVAGRFEGRQNFRDYFQTFNDVMAALNTSVKDKLTILGVAPEYKELLSDVNEDLNLQYDQIIEKLARRIDGDRELTDQADIREFVAKGSKVHNSLPLHVAKCSSMLKDFNVNKKPIPLTDSESMGLFLTGLNEDVKEELKQQFQKSSGEKWDEN
jgi:hypothetical protein